MKSALLGLSLLLVSSAGATSPMHPYMASVRDIHAILGDKEVQKTLSAYNQRVTAVSNEALKSGQMGWVISTEKCDLEVQLAWKSAGIGLFNMRPVVTVGQCQ